MRIRVLFLLTAGLCIARNCHAQLQIDAGDGTLFGAGRQSAGIGAHLYRGSVTDYVGVTMVGKKFIPGASTEFSFHNTDITAGTQAMYFNSDVSGISLQLVGISARRSFKKTRVSFFVGASGAAQFLPSSFGVVPHDFGAGLSISREFIRRDHHFRISSIDATSTRLTSAHTLTYLYKTSQANIGAGWLNAEKFWSASGVLSVRGISISASRSQFFIPFAVIGTGANVGYSHSFFNVGAGLNRSISRIRIDGVNANAGFHFWRIQESSGWYRSGQSVLYHFINERISSRLQISENITQAGHTAISFGGNWSGNRVQFGLQHGLQFILGRGYRQSTEISISFRIHDSVISAQNVADIFGRNLWAINSTNYFQIGQATPAVHRQDIKAKYVFFGFCRLNGEPMQGCTVQLGKDVVISNTSGEFCLRSNKKTLAVIVNPEEFAAPGSYQVISAPTYANAGQTIFVEVRRK